MSSGMFQTKGASKYHVVSVGEGGYEMTMIHHEGEVTQIDHVVTWNHASHEREQIYFALRIFRKNMRITFHYLRTDTQ